MAKTLPGTTIAVDWNRPEEAETLLNSLFLAGGLMLSQVASLTGLEPYVIQNWVRRGFVAPPERKRYSRRQFSRIVLINMLKDSMQLDKICALLSYVNGELDDESDDLIDDFQLYLYIVRLAALVEHQPPSGPDEAARWGQTAAGNYCEWVPGRPGPGGPLPPCDPDGLSGRTAQTGGGGPPRGPGLTRPKTAVGTRSIPPLFYDRSHPHFEKGGTHSWQPGGNPSLPWTTFCSTSPSPPR